MNGPEANDSGVGPRFMAPPSFWRSHKADRVGRCAHHTWGATASLATLRRQVSMTLTSSITRLLMPTVLILTGCEDHPGMQAPPPLPPPAARADGAARLDSAFSATLQMPSRVVEGEQVPLLLVVRNITQKPVYFETGDSTTTFDIQVTDSSGAVVWRRMHNRESLASLREVTLAPGQEIRFGDHWGQRSNGGSLVPGGRYEVQGTLLAEGGLTLKTAPTRLLVATNADR